jgi:hypothetical protein
MALRSPYTSPSVRSPDFPFVRRLSNSSPTAGANNWFVRSLAVGNGSGVNWLNAFTTLSAALTGKAAGDKFWVSDDHAETQASAITLTSPGTAAAPCPIYCVNLLGTIPPVSADLRTTATVSTTGANGITFVGCFYCYGITFNCSTSGVADATLVGGPNSQTQQFEACALRNGGFGGLSIGSTTSTRTNATTLTNTTVQFASTGSNISLQNCFLTWRKTASAVTGGTIPSSLFGNAGSFACTALIEGVDLSALAAGTTLVAASSTSTPSQFTFKDCKFGASVTVASTPGSPGHPRVVIVRSDSSGTNYRSEKYDYTGTQTVETTIVRTGGASDGTTPLSWKIVTTANSKWTLPFEALPIAIWNDTTGSLVTVTVEGIWGSTNLPQTDDIWFEIEGLGSAASPQGSFGTGSKADNLANGTVWATSSQVWGGSTTAFAMTATFTPQQKGALYIYVKAAKASTTFYIDPKVTLS